MYYVGTPRPRCKMHSWSRKDSGRITRWLWPCKYRAIAAAADAALQKLLNEDAVSGPFQIAVVYGLRKEPDKMFEWLERAYTEHDPGLTQLLVTPFILNYKDDPRFAAFCQKLKVQFPPPAGAAKP